MKHFVLKGMFTNDPCNHNITIWIAADHLQVNTLIARELSGFTNNEKEISILHSAASCHIENFKFIVSEQVSQSHGVMTVVC